METLGMYPHFGYYWHCGVLIRFLNRAVLHDETLYGPDVEKFNPDRFMRADGEKPPHPEQYAFGFGRR